MILTAVLFVPVSTTAARGAHRDFVNGVRLRTNTADFTIKRFTTSVDALISRTVIRQYLYDYVQGERTFRELVDFTVPRYADGARVIEDLVGARRILMDGTVVTAFGDQENLDGQEPGVEIRIVRDHTPLLIIIERPIRESDQIIGYDQAAFDASVLVADPEPGILGFSLAKEDETVSARFRHAEPLAAAPFYLVGEMDPQVLRDLRLEILGQILLYTVLSSLAIVLVLYLTLYRFVERVIARLDKALGDKDLLLRESTHRIKNNFAIAESFLRIQSRTTSNQEAQRILQEAQSRMSNMRVLYDRMLATKELRTVDMKKYLQELCDTVVHAYNLGRNITLHTRIDALTVDPKTAFSLGAIVTELLTNSVKYAYPHGERGTIKVELAAGNGDGKEAPGTTLKVCDDGIGLPKDLDRNPSHSFGLTVVRMTAEQLGGTAVISSPAAGSTSGTCCVVSLPV